MNTGVLAMMALLAVAAAPAGDDKAAPPPSKVRAVTVYGDDPCPKPSSDDEIVVCGRLSENDRYRIPKEFRDDDRPVDAPSASWTSRTRLVDDVNRVSMPGSCSVVGSFGQSGCSMQYLRDWQEFRADELRKASRVP